jgi:hypothetical protein
MRRRWRERAAATAVALTLAAAAAAQADATPFTAPDGSRFLLCPDPTAAAVHWAVASPIDLAQDPPGHEGLAGTVARASLHGTWRIGSHDAAREKEALLWLEEAWLRMLRDPRDAVAADDVKRWDDAARELADRRAWLRALAAAPAWQPELTAVGGAAVLTVTTTRAALPEVARLLVERREDVALRELPRAWMETFQARGRAHVADGRRGVRAELLALTMPDQPGSRAVEAPNPAPPTREQATACWAASQHPTRVRHVLVGDFDVAAAQATLAAAFARSDLVAPSTPSNARPRPLAGVRRSSVAGVPTPVVALAWPLPDGLDGDTLAATLLWLGGDDGAITRRVRADGRATARVTLTGPWPSAPDGLGLLVVEATDPSGQAGLGDAVLAACRAAIAAPPTAADIGRIERARVRGWQASNGDARAQAAAAAARWLTWPSQPPRLGPPPAPDAKLLLDCAQRLCGAPPAIVEGAP